MVCMILRSLSPVPFALLLEHFLLLLLQGFESCGEAGGFLVGIVLIGLIVLFEFGEELGVVGRLAQVSHGERGEEERDEIVVVKAGRVLVEHEEEE